MYRWHPHGSKKLDDIMCENGTSWLAKQTTPTALFHDQEPLNFDLYNTDYLRLHWSQKITVDPTSAVFDYIISTHLRSFFCYNGYDLSIICHSEQHSRELTKYQTKGFVGAYYWSHALISRDWFRFAEHDRALDITKPCYLFLVYNRSWSGTREYRLKFAELLLNTNLKDSCLMTFNPVDEDSFYTNHRFSNSKFQIARTDLQTQFDINCAGSHSSADYVNTDYQQIQIEVVLETLFDDQRLHLTEKSLRPIACGKPFILAATGGSLQYLRNYGFETFHPWINETYDTIHDPYDRLVAIITEMQRLQTLDSNQKQQMLAATADIASRNKRRFFSQAWFDQVVQEYQINMDQAVKTVKAGGRGSFYQNLEPLLTPNLVETQYYKKAFPGVRTLSEMQQYLEWVRTGI